MSTSGAERGCSTAGSRKRGARLHWGPLNPLGCSLWLSMGLEEGAARTCRRPGLDLRAYKNQDEHMAWNHSFIIASITWVKGYPIEPPSCPSPAGSLPIVQEPRSCTFGDANPQAQGRCSGSWACPTPSSPAPNCWTVFSYPDILVPAQI